jgi:hypothetical protein
MGNGRKEIGEKVKVGKKSGAGGKIKEEMTAGRRNAGQKRWTNQASRHPLPQLPGDAPGERFPAGCKTSGCGDFQLAWRWRFILFCPWFYPSVTSHKSTCDFTPIYSCRGSYPQAAAGKKARAAGLAGNQHAP